MRLEITILLLFSLLLASTGTSANKAYVFRYSKLTTKYCISEDSIQGFADKTVYRIELLISKDPIYLAPANFNGLENVKEIYENGLYSYTSGYSHDYSYSRDVLLNQVKKLGFTNPTIAAYKNNARIELDTNISNNNLQKDLSSNSSIYFLIEPDGRIEYLNPELETNDLSNSGEAPIITGLNPTFSLGAGVFSYFGDLKPFDSMGRIGDNLGFDLQILSQFNKYLSGGLFFLKGKLTTDERSDTRNLNFQSKISVGGLMVSHNLSHWVHEDSRLRPYFSLGIEAFEFNSKGDLLDANGNPYYYWSDGSIRIEPELGTNPNATTTSRDFIYESDLREADLDGLGKYPQFSFAIPVGLGITFDITDNLSLKAGTSMHLTFTDMIDDISDNGFNAREGNSNMEKFMYTSFSLRYNLVDAKKPVEQEPDSLLLAVTDSIASDTTDKETADTSWTSGTIQKEVADGTITPKNDSDTSLRVLPFNQDSIDQEGLNDFALNANKNRVDEDDRVEASEKIHDSDTSLRVLPFNQDSVDLDRLGDFDLNTKKEKGEKEINEYDLSTIVRNDSIWTVNQDLFKPLLTEDEKQESISKKDSIWQVLLGIFPKGEYPSQEFENKILSIPGVVSKVVNDTVFYTAPTTSVNEATIVYRVQLGAFSKQIPLAFFKLEGVVMIPGKDGLFKYLSGEFNNYLEARRHRQQMVGTGFEDAFVAVFKGGERITVRDAGITAENVEQLDMQEAEEIAMEVVFKIQIHASRNPIYNAPQNFKGLENVNEYFNNGLYKYTVDMTKDFGYAMDVLLPNIRRLYTDAFVVAFRKETRLTREEVIRYLNRNK